MRPAYCSAAIGISEPIKIARGTGNPTAKASVGINALHADAPMRRSQAVHAHELEAAMSRAVRLC